MAELSVEISAKIEKLLSELKKAKNALKGFGEVGKEIKVKLKRVFSGIGEVINKLKIKISQLTDKFKQAGEKMGRIGRSMTTYLTLPLVAFAAVAAKSFASFESELSKIEGLVGIAGDKVAEMGEKALVMASKFGKSGKEAAEALFFITSAGLRGKDAMEVLEASLKASVIGLGDTKTVADLATSAMNAYGIKALSAAQATDIMTAAVREGKLDATTLAGSMGRVLPIAAAMGVKFNEVGAAFAAMSRTGTKADEAATQLRGILSSLLNPASEAEKVLKELGLSSNGLRKNIADKGLLNTLEILTQKFEGNSEKAGLVFGNVRALSGVLDLMGKNVGETRNIFSKMNNTLGDTDKAFEVTAKTAGFRFSVALKSLQNSFIEIGKVISVVFLPIVEKVGLFLKKLSEKFSRLSPETKKTIVVITALVAAIGPLLIALGFLSTTIIPALVTGFGILISKVVYTAGVFKTLTAVMAANPFGLLAVAIAAVVSYFVFFNDEVEKTVKKQSLLSRVTDKATKSISKERANLASLLAIARHEGVSKKQRLKAISEINRISPKYLGNIKLETINTDAARVAIENYNKHLIQSATIKAAQVKLQAIQAKKIEIEVSQAKKLVKDAAKLIKLKEDAVTLEEILKVRNLERIGYGETSNGLQAAQLKGLQDEEDILLKIIAAHAKKNDVVASGGSTKLRKKATGINTEGLASGFSFADDNLSLMPRVNSTQFDEDAAAMILKAQEFSDGVTDILQNGVLSTFEQLGNNIGMALANGGNVIQAFMGSILGAMGSTLQQYGSLVVAAGIASEAFKESMKNPFGGGIGAIIAGTALIAIGGAVKSFSGSLGKGSSGGGGGSSSGAGASNFSGSSGGGNFGASSGGGMQNVVFEIQGTKLVGVLSNTLSRNRSLGGSLSIT